MKRLLFLIIIFAGCLHFISGQEFDLTFTGAESNNQTHTARNSVTLGPGYSYTPAGGNLTIDIQNPVVNGIVTYTGTPVDPETRTLNTSTYLVGATNGSLNVNPMGGSVYSVPLEMLPGVNGLSPGLSLEYSSNRGPGIAGYGWQIGGLSVISRGPQTYYHDGSAKGVNLDNDDRFYLDGQRLVNTTTYSYGDINAQYRTDIDIFTRVTPQSTNSFKAETKSGLIFEYGNNPGSKQLITGSYQIVNWYVSKISDLFGNQINFAYLQDNFSFYPAEITYGPNTITFYYKERNDKTCSYLKGVKIEQNLLLDKIVIKYNTAVVKTYEFKYTYQGSYYNSYSTLNEIIEYGVGTGRFNSTALTYQIPANVSFTQTTYNTSHQYVNYKSRLIPGDYDGDGKTDFFCLPDATKGATWTGLKVYFSDGNDNFINSFSQSTLVPGSGMTLRDIRSLDINGDGRDDILYEEGSSSQSTFKYMISNGNSFASPVVFFTNSTNSSVTGISGKRNRMQFTQGDDNEFTSIKVPSFSHFLTSSQVTRAMKKSDKSVAADYNGDGVNDIFVNFPAGNWIIRSLVNSYGQMTPSMNYIGSGLQPVITKEVLSGDFNGDGKADIWSFEDTGLKIYTLVGTGLDTLYISNWPTRKHFFNLGDFNGDGKVDMFIYGAGRDATEYDWSEWQIRLSTGTDFIPYYIPKKKNNLKDDLVRLGDFDGDGSTDIMVTAKEISWNGIYFYISKNNGTDLYVHNIAGYPVPTHNFYGADFDGDGHHDFILTDGQYPWWTGYQVYKTTGKTSVLLEKAGNGLGNLTKLTYTKLSQASAGIYQRGSGAEYPLADFKGPWNVVTSVQYDNGKGSLNTQNYYYEGVKIHLQGKGSLGFTKTRISDVASGIDNESVITSGFNTTYFYPNVYLTLRKRSNTTDTLEKTKNTMYRKEFDATKKWFFPFIQVSTRTDKLTGHSVTVNSSYDDYGNPTSIVKNYGSGKAETTLLVYDDSLYIGKWHIGRPASSTKTQYIQGNDTIRKIEWKVFDESNNNLKSIIWHQGDAVYECKRGFKYNPNGTLKRDSISANGSWRTTIYTYESNSIRIKTIKDPLSHTDSLTYDIYGRLQTKSDYLNNTLTYQYDAMGRDTSVVSSDGSRTRTVYGWETPASVPKPARYSVQKTGNDGSQSKSWFDKLGREIRSDVKGFNGTWIYTVKRYNLKGQTDSVSEPYYSNETPIWNRYQYDNYGRITSLTRPSGRNSSWGYNNNIVTETTGGKSFTKTYASDGTLSSAQDAGGTITYNYFPDGKIRTISAPGSIITQMEYDIAGNQKKLIDPSAGTINYTYNGYGELVTQQNARSQTTTIIYNADGTIKRKDTPEGLVKYRYNPTNKQLVNVNSYETVSHTYSYDSKGRVISVIDTIPGTTPLTTSYSYDSYGRMSTVTHPSGITETYNYNVNGYLSSISAGGSTRWTTTSMNARGQVTAGQYGSDLSSTYGFDAYGYPTSTVTGTLQSYSYNFNTVTGNLAWRQNNKYTGLKETFNYDNSDRLDNVYKGTGTPVLTLDMAYDSNKGGITTKSDAGTMIYNYPGNPYALGAICPTTGLLPSNTQTLTYTSFESINTISENNYVASLTYNPEAQRAKMVVQQSGNTILTRWYSGSSYVKETAGGVTKQYTYIGGDAYTAPVVAIKTGTGTPVYYYLLRDHLGSITHVVNTSKTTVAEYSYDSWGRMRNPTNWTNYAPGTEPALFVAGRGFTGHEHLPWFNSINMNGRIYDPLIGQFLSPDNFVQAPDFTQNYNRYTYCLNNPLKYNDPSGMLAKEKDPQSDAWFDAYFGWLCNRDMNTISVGGGGGWGGYVIGADQDYVGTTMYNSNVKFYGYSYNAPANTYYSKYTGENASWGEVYYNYVVPNSIISLSGKVAQDLIKVYQREISSSLFGINNWGASLLAGPGGAVDLAYQIANTLNEFNPVAQLWDVIAYAFTGKDRFGNEMSLTQASLKALCVVPIFKAGSISYSFGAYKSSGKWISQMASRGWTGNTIQEALTIGKKYPAINKVNPANNATRFVHPATGQSVVVDDITNEIIHLGGPGFKY